MTSPPPTSRQIRELVAYLPQLHAKGFRPIRRWGGGTQDKDGVLEMPWPEYRPIVQQFFRVAARECWCDRDYLPKNAHLALQDHGAVRHASLAEVRAMLTYCVRGERFCDGHLADQQVKASAVVEPRTSLNSI